jgi:hypothetical protein
MWTLWLAGCAPESAPVGEVRNPTGYRSAVSTGDADFACEYVEEACPSACDGNRAPALGHPVYVVGSVAVDEVVLGDDVEVRVPFSDPDANLGCGWETWSFDSPPLSMNSTGSTCSNMPASSEESGVYLVFDLGTILEGDYSYAVRLSDGCGADSNRVEETWTF